MRILVNIWHFGQHHWNFARGPSDLDMETHDREDHQQVALQHPRPRRGAPSLSTGLKTVTEHHEAVACRDLHIRTLPPAPRTRNQPMESTLWPTFCQGQVSTEVIVLLSPGISSTLLRFRAPAALLQTSTALLSTGTAHRPSAGTACPSTTMTWSATTSMILSARWGPIDVNAAPQTSTAPRAQIWVHRPTGIASSTLRYSSSVSEARSIN